MLPLAAINAAVALTVLLVMARQIPAAISYGDGQKLLLFAFEISVVVVTALAVLGFRVPNWLIVAQAAVNLLLASALALFLYTFKLTRLF